MKKVAILLVSITALVLLVVGIPTITASETVAETAVAPDVPSGWVAIGRSMNNNGINNTTNVATRPEVFVDHNDYLYVAWEEQLSIAQREIYLLRWNGSSWVGLGGSSSGNGVSNLGRLSENPDVAVHTDGTLYVAWSSPNSDGQHHIYVKKWNGSYWAGIDGSASNNGISSELYSAVNPSIAIDKNGVLYVAYNGDASQGADGEIYVKKLTNSTWSTVGSGSTSGGGISNTTADSSYAPSIALDSNNRPYVAWTEVRSSDAETYMRYWNGSSWVALGNSASGSGVSNSADDALEPFIAISDSDTPYISWHNIVNGERQIYVRRWERSAWREVGTGSATGGGISNTADDSLKSQIHILSDDYLYVSWQDWGSPNLVDVYIRRWNGSYWEEVSTGSASGTGISDSSPRSIHPTLGVDSSNQIYLVWSDTNAGKDPTEGVIHGRRYQNAPCYTLTRTHTGAGSDPVASVNNSTGCPAGTYVAGDLIYLTASPDGGWEVAGWNNTNNDSSTSISNQVTMPANNLTVRVDYAQSCYPLTLTHSGNGSNPTATPNNSSGCSVGYYKSGEFISLTAAPANGSQVSSWDNTNNDSSTSTSNSVTMPSSAWTVQVNYAPVVDDGCYLLVLTHEGNGSSPTADPASSSGCDGNGRYKFNEVVILSASPANGWKVKEWDGTNRDSSTSTTNTITMPASNAVASVIYEPICYTLSMTYDTNGGSKPLASGSLSSCEPGTYTAGELVSLTAVPYSGWSVTGWLNTNNDNTTSRFNSVTMPARNLTISVIYATGPIASDVYLPFVTHSGRPPYFDGDEEREPNNTFGAANGPMESGKQYQGRPNDSFDLFYIDPVRAGTIRVTVSNLPNSDITQLQLYEEGSNAFIVRDFEPVNGMLEINYPFTQTKRYFIAIFRNPERTDNNPYRLTITYPAP